jgi:hypothetical protein
MEASNMLQSMSGGGEIKQMQVKETQHTNHGIRQWTRHFSISLWKK